MEPPAARELPFGIRRLTPADAAAYRSLRLLGLEQHPAAFGSSWEEERVRPLSWFAGRVDANLVFGAWSGGTELMGVAGLLVPAGEKMRHRGLLWGMFVRAEARGTGMASALVAAVVEAARGVVEEVDLTVVASNCSAIGLYRAAGFREYGLAPRVLKVAGVYHDELLMTLSLASSSAVPVDP